MNNVEVDKFEKLVIGKRRGAKSQEKTKHRPKKR
jgi:hypothetical protein